MPRPGVDAELTRLLRERDTIELPNIGGMIYSIW